MNQSLSDPNEGKVIGKGYTPDGLVLYIRREGKDWPMQVPPVDASTVTVPPELTRDLAGYMFTVWDYIEQVKGIKRHIPLTRNECVDGGIPKKILRELENLGIIKQELVPIVDSKTRKKVGAKACLWFTPYGKAIIQLAGAVNEQPGNPE